MLFSDSRLANSLMEKRQEDRARVGSSRYLGTATTRPASRLAALAQRLPVHLPRLRPERTNKLVLH